MRPTTKAMAERRSSSSRYGLGPLSTSTRQAKDDWANRDSASGTTLAETVGSAPNAIDLAPLRVSAMVSTPCCKVPSPASA
jgi:hypothetical protein